MPVGTTITPAQILQSLIFVLDISIYGVSLAVFVIGAFVYATSGISEGDASARKNMGKEFMIGAIIGFFIVRAAWLFLGAAIVYLYG
ncbi:MAG TPA: hypothetical protein VI913_01510 [Candidatus Peribacteraceae bacterium]|nr:hypothetical protein [Candidatus Peribacteraceae bacterium]